MKLADFGLSKTLPINKHASFDLESKFKLTGETGSYRYMAPEVFRHEPYNYKARCALIGSCMVGIACCIYSQAEVLGGVAMAGPDSLSCSPSTCSQRPTCPAPELCQCTCRPWLYCGIHASNAVCQHATLQQR